jgi:hypothetical protein
MTVPKNTVSRGNDDDDGRTAISEDVPACDELQFESFGFFGPLLA